MTDRTNSTKTKIGREKAAQAISNKNTNAEIVYMAFGSGGTDSNGAPKNLTGEETGLFNQVVVKPVEVAYPTSTTARFSGVINSDVDGLVGTKINEVGLIDSDGDFIAIKTFTDKELDSEVLFEVDYDVEY